MADEVETIFVWISGLRSSRPCSINLSFLPEIQGVSKRALQEYSKCGECNKMFTLKVLNDG
jgi:hypothetical protein